MRLPLALPLCLIGMAAGAEGLSLNAENQAAFDAEMRAFLLDNADLIAMALDPAGQIGPIGYQDEITDDLARINRYAEALFNPDRPLLGTDGPIAFASFAAANSATARFLTDYATSRGIRIALHDPATSGDLMSALQIDLIPTHIFPDLMVRGDVPAIVLDRYLP